MRKFLWPVAVAMVALAGPAAASEFERNVFGGVLAGAGVGALIGSAAGPGAAVGAAVGGAAGGVIVFLIRPDGCFIQNRRGELWQVPCRGRTVRGASACYIGNELSGLHQVSCPARL